VIGIDASATLDQTVEQVHRIATNTADQDRAGPASSATMRSSSYPATRGRRTGCPMQQTVDAIHLAARTEAMLTDPVYEGKSMAGLIGMIRSGEIPAGSKVLYCHLGGQPALSAYAGFPGLGSPERELSC
jgi:1-aminocyclopropane-1-carboxylate deaminase